MLQLSESSSETVTNIPASTDTANSISADVEENVESNSSMDIDFSSTAHIPAKRKGWSLEDDDEEDEDDDSNDSGNKMKVDKTSISDVSKSITQSFGMLLIIIVI